MTSARTPTVTSLHLKCERMYYTCTGVYIPLTPHNMCRAWIMSADSLVCCPRRHDVTRVCTTHGYVALVGMM